MKQRLLSRIMLGSAFAVGLAVPLTSTHTSSAQAQAFVSCSPISGRDSWTGFTAGAGSYTVTVSYDTGVSITGTPPPLADLPLVLTSTSGHQLTISADASGARVYEGDFTGEVPASCACSNMTCDPYGSACISSVGMTCSITTGGGCVSSPCGGGSCSGGSCTAVFDFKAAF